MMVTESRYDRPVEPNELVPADYFKELPFGEHFANDAPVEIDLGCGDGSFVLGMAEHYPDRNFLAVERLLGRVRKVCKRSHKMGLKNFPRGPNDSRQDVKFQGLQSELLSVFTKRKEENRTGDANTDSPGGPSRPQVLPRNLFECRGRPSQVNNRTYVVD